MNLFRLFAYPVEPPRTAPDGDFLDLVGSRIDWTPDGTTCARLTSFEQLVDRWDGEYRRGDWNFLRGGSERARYAALAKCIVGRDSSSPKLVLDLGCGAGVLREHLREESLERYTGVDVSSEAIASARLGRHRRSTFIAASIDEWHPDRQYNAIVFNEVLYYLPEPLATMHRYAGWLSTGGSLYVSMWHPAALLSVRGPTRAKVVRARLAHGRIWSDINGTYDVVTDLTVQSNRLQRWRIEELCARRARRQEA
jgi:SAM-dependent methyltransferase